MSPLFTVGPTLRAQGIMDPKMPPLQAQSDRQQCIGFKSYLTSPESVLMTLQTPVSAILTTTLQSRHHPRSNIPDGERVAERLGRLSGPEDGYADTRVHVSVRAHTKSAHVYVGTHPNRQGDGLMCLSSFSESRSQEGAPSLLESWCRGK